MNSDPGTMPEIMSLNPAELIEWCKERKKFLGISNQKLSELSKVPVGTIDRIMAGRYTEFRYSSVQPIIAVLIGFNKATPVPDDSDTEQGQYYYETIEGYKLIVENKNHEIEELQRNVAILSKELDFIKKENAAKQQIIENYHSHTQWLEKIIDDLRDLIKSKKA